MRRRRPEYRTRPVGSDYDGRAVSSLCELGEQHGVAPQLELWGFARVLSKLSEVAYVAIEAAHPQAGILADSYHLYKGGSDYDSLRLLAGAAMHVFHINDYPASRSARKSLTRIGSFRRRRGSLGMLFRSADSGFRGMLSLEVFNREYWNQDAPSVARTGWRRPARRCGKGWRSRFAWCCDVLWRCRHWRSRRSGTRERWRTRRQITREGWRPVGKSTSGVSPLVPAGPDNELSGPPWGRIGVVKLCVGPGTGIARGTRGFDTRRQINFGREASCPCGTQTTSCLGHPGMKVIV